MSKLLFFFFLHCQGLSPPQSLSRTQISWHFPTWNWQPKLLWLPHHCSKLSQVSSYCMSLDPGCLVTLQLQISWINASWGGEREKGLCKSLQIRLWTGKKWICNIDGSDADEQFLFEAEDTAGAFTNFIFRLFLQIFQSRPLEVL